MFTCLSSNLWLTKKWFRELQQDGDLPHSGQNQPFLQTERSSLLQPGHWRGGGVCHAHHQLINEIVIMITSIIITTVMRYLQHHHYYCHSTNYVSLTFLSLVLLCSIPKMSQFCQNTNPFCFTLFIVQLLCLIVSGTTIEAGRPDDLNWSIQHIVNIIKSSTAASIADNKPNLIKIDK